ncbi:MAG: TMEM143 family protein [Leptolyngbyaceae cyanobacterium]
MHIAVPETTFSTQVIDKIYRSLENKTAPIRLIRSMEKQTPQPEAFIPYPRQDIVQLCMQDGRLDLATAGTFQSFCDLLAAFYHIQFHSALETLKENYRVFNPNAEIQPLFEESLQEREQMAAQVVHTFKQILEQANYYPMPNEVIQQSLADRSLVQLKTEVDFNDFEDFLCYCRGDVNKTTTKKRFVFWEKEHTIDIFERLVLLIRFKGPGHFRAKANRQQSALGRTFDPGKMYVYFYKNIPKLDLDLLFPNTQTSMTLRDRVMLIGPAIGAAVPLLIKTLPNVLLLIAAIMIAVNARSALQSINVEEDQARQVMPVLIATLTLAIALGGFAVKQYSQYKNKRIKFQKEVTDTLFFKNLANNASVFQMLVDLAEEEECKEVILVYYHLLTSPTPLTAPALDAKIEAWLLEKTGKTINFDIQGPLQNLEKIRGCTQPGGKRQSLLTYDSQNRCQVLSLEQARTVLDYVWDNLFRYNGSL